MNLIAAVNDNWGIGYNNQLLYHIPEDLKRFQYLTTNKIVFMGRKTFESSNKFPLSNRINVVLSTTMTNHAHDYIVMNSIEDALAFLKFYRSSDVFVIGGSTIYEQFLPYCDTAYITKVYDDKKADAFMPNLDKNDHCKAEEISSLYSYYDLMYSFITYKKR